MEADISALDAQFTLVVRRAIELQKEMKEEKSQWDMSADNFKKRLKSLLAQWQDANQLFSSLASEGKLKTQLTRPAFPSHLDWDEGFSLLDEIRIQSAKALGALSGLHRPLSQRERERLTALRQELGKVASLLTEDVYFKNIEKAIEEYEALHFLGSALIASRIVAYILQGVEGEDITAKIKTLQLQGVLDIRRDDVKESIIKTNQKSRNFLSHDIRISAEASDALALLGDTIKLVNVVAKRPSSRLGTLE